METLYHQTKKMVHQVQGGLSRLEKSRGDDVHIVENEVQAEIDHIISSCERLDILVNKEPPSRRASAKLGVDQLKYDCQHLQSALRNLQHRRYQREEEEREREALMSRNFEPNDVDTAIFMDAELQHNQKLSDTDREMNELLHSGGTILTNLKEQRVTLKGAHKKILDVANTLGLSNTVLRLIERRTYQDKFIFYAGILVTIVIMFLVWKYFT